MKLSVKWQAWQRNLEEANISTRLHPSAAHNVKENSNDLYLYLVHGIYAVPWIDRLQSWRSTWLGLWWWHISCTKPHVPMLTFHLKVNLLLHIAVQSKTARGECWSRFSVIFCHFIVCPDAGHYSQVQRTFLLEYASLLMRLCIVDDAYWLHILCAWNALPCYLPDSVHPLIRLMDSLYVKFLQRAGDLKVLSWYYLWSALTVMGMALCQRQNGLHNDDWSEKRQCLACIREQSAMTLQTPDQKNLEDGLAGLLREEFVLLLQTLRR